MKKSKIGTIVNKLRKHPNGEVSTQATATLKAMRQGLRKTVEAKEEKENKTKKRKKAAPKAKGETKMPGTGNMLPPPPCTHPAKSVPCGDVNRKRVRVLREGDGMLEGPVVYWMSRDQRAEDNWALLFAQALAQKEKPVVVVFNLLTSYLNAPLRHFDFMVKGLQETERALRKHHIPFYVVTGDASENIPRFVREIGASALVCDFSPMRGGRQWRDRIVEALTEEAGEATKKAKKAKKEEEEGKEGKEEEEEKDPRSVPFYEVDAHNVVPVWLASVKQEWSAATFRRRIYEYLPSFMRDYPALGKNAPFANPPTNTAYGGQGDDSLVPWTKLVASLKCDKSIGPVAGFTPGTAAGKKTLEEFIEKRLKHYAKLRNVPDQNHLSHLSPYFHYGHISPQRAALEVVKHKTKHKEGVEAFYEESVVRRELSDNFCYYQPNYDKYEGIPPWAKKTHAEHADDDREYLYTDDELEKSKTHDDLWNAAQLEMVKSGKMHGFLRMYWAKKILEWTESPQKAFDLSIKLNDKYSLDGRDPNGYVGCGWAIAGVHDRAWTERPVFGKIRFMNYKGCKRKFNIPAYIQRVKSIAKAAAKP